MNNIVVFELDEIIDKIFATEPLPANTMYLVKDDENEEYVFKLLLDIALGGLTKLLDRLSKTYPELQNITLADINSDDDPLIDKFNNYFNALCYKVRILEINKELVSTYSWHTLIKTNMIPSTFSELSHTPLYYLIHKHTSPPYFAIFSNRSGERYFKLYFVKN